MNKCLSDPEVVKQILVEMKGQSDGAKADRIAERLGSRIRQRITREREAQGATRAFVETTDKV